MFKVTSKHRGLVNKSGQNNCFLNVTIQALWHLGPFRYELQRLLSDPAHQPTNKSGKLLPTLCKLFYDYEFSELSILPPTELREVLHSLSDQFELGSFADSNEALNVILEQIHNEHEPGCCVSSSSSSTTSSSPSKCISHTVFGISLMEQVICNVCSASSEPVMHNDFMQTIYAAQLIEHVSYSFVITNNSVLSSNYNFSEILRNCIQLESKCCPTIADDESSTTPTRKSSAASRTSFFTSTFTTTAVKTKDKNIIPTKGPCQGRGEVRGFCLEPPMSLAFSVVWAQDTESSENISDFLSLISYTINLNEVFPGSGNTTPNKAAVEEKIIYVFRGLVCYYGHHYVSIFQEYSPGEPQFLLFDDQNVRKIGNWNDVKIECIKSHYQPVLLLYEMEKVEEVNSSNSNNGSSSVLAVPGILREKADHAISNTTTKSTLKNNTKSNQTNDTTTTAKKALNFLSPRLTRSLANPFSTKYAESDATLRKSLSTSKKQLLSDIDLAELNSLRLSQSSSNGTGNNSKTAPASTSGHSDTNNKINNNTTTPTIITSVSNAIPPSAIAAPSTIKSSRIYKVTLKPIKYKDNTYIIGLGFEAVNKQIIVTNFTVHPIMKEKLPAEKSNEIKLLDELIGINDILLHSSQNATLEGKEIWAIVMETMKNLSSKPVTFTFKAYDYDSEH